MSFARVEVEGAKELRRLLKDLDEKEIPKAVRLANKSAADVIAREAKTRAPVRTGRLRNSIRSGATKAAATVRAGNKRVPYANAVHWGRKEGNVGSPPGNHKGKNPVQGKRFIWDAANNANGEAVETYKREIGAVLARLGSRGVNGGS